MQAGGVGDDNPCNQCITTAAVQKLKAIPPHKNCDTTGDRVANTFIGMGKGIVGFLGFGGFLPGPSDDDIGSLKNQYQQLQNQWNTCIQNCRDRLNSDQLNWCNDITYAIQANQQLFNLQISEKVQTSFLLIFFAIGLSAIMIVYLLTEKK